MIWQRQLVGTDDLVKMTMSREWFGEINYSILYLVGLVKANVCDPKEMIFKDGLLKPWMVR
jgi:hypothetical protein